MNSKVLFQETQESRGKVSISPAPVLFFSNMYHFYQPFTACSGKRPIV
jgi:hypothetical protein